MASAITILFLPQMAMLAGPMSRYSRKIVEAQKHKKLTHEIQLIVKRRQGQGRQRSRAKV
jgi:hypothetical protein